MASVLSVLRKALCTEPASLLTLALLSPVFLSLKLTVFLSFHPIVFLWCGVCRTTAVCPLTSLPWQPLSALSRRRQGARKSPSQMLSPIFMFSDAIMTLIRLMLTMMVVMTAMVFHLSVRLKLCVYFGRQSLI